jgi:RNA polymerase subunit RPABC4/transcription elongation factor Spt4
MFSGRWLAIVGGLVVAAGSLMAWVNLPVLGVSIPVSGIFSLGCLTFALGLVAAYFIYRGFRWRIFYVATAGVLLYVSFLSARRVRQETHASLLRMEMRLYPINQAIAQLGAPPLSVVDTTKRTDEYVGVGLQVVPIGAGLLLLGCLLDLFSRRLSLKSLPLEFIGFLACRHCASLLSGEMLTCPRCGQSVSEKKVCRNCFQVLDEGHRFCFRCGQAVKNP